MLCPGQKGASVRVFVPGPQDPRDWGEGPVTGHPEKATSDILDNHNPCGRAQEVAPGGRLALVRAPHSQWPVGWGVEGARLGLAGVTGLPPTL